MQNYLRILIFILVKYDLSLEIQQENNILVKKYDRVIILMN